ncbi:MAG: DMT family transporter [Gammaproteobacteria bacterium]|nr:DMT family transporter [Gammaproteobacteria bacterium]
MSVPAAYLGVILIWSTTPLAIQWSSSGVGFMFGLTARMTLGAVLCALLLLVLRQPIAWHDAARRTYLFAGVALYGAMLSVYWAAQYIPSGLVSVVYGLTPIVTSIFAAIWLGERAFQAHKLMGIGFGIVGLVIIFHPSGELEHNMVLGVMGVLMSVIIHSASMVWVKRLGAQVSAVAVTGGALWVALALYLVTWFVLDGQLPNAIPDRTVNAILYLGVMGSVVGFVLFYYALKHVSAGGMALLTLVTPVLALAMGHLLNGEVLAMQTLYGAGIILAGLAIHQWGDKVFSRPLKP